MSLVKLKIQAGMCLQQRLKSVFASLQFDHSLSFPPGETLDPWLPIECPSKDLIRLCCREVWSESSLDTHANLYLSLDTDTGNYKLLFLCLREISNFADTYFS